MSNASEAETTSKLYIVYIAKCYEKKQRLYGLFMETRLYQVIAHRKETKQ